MAVKTVMRSIITPDVGASRPNSNKKAGEFPHRPFVCQRELNSVD
jgi:hypothetical protein